MENSLVVLHLLGIDRDWIECKDRQLWVEIEFLYVSIM